MTDWKGLWNKYKPIVLQVAIALLAGGLAALLGGETATLYGRLESPPLAPPGWVFPVVWTILYVLMGIAAGIVAKSGDEDSRQAMALYYLQLGLNVLWPLIFFRFEWITLAAVWLLLLTAAVYTAWMRFRAINKVAGWLLVPYLLWCLFALYLNIGFAVLN